MIEDLLLEVSKMERERTELIGEIADRLLSLEKQAREKGPDYISWHSVERIQELEKRIKALESERYDEGNERREMEASLLNQIETRRCDFSNPLSRNA